jgi:hypothetical protein
LNAIYLLCPDYTGFSYRTAPKDAQKPLLLLSWLVSLDNALISDGQ